MNGLTPGGGVPLGLPVAWSNRPSFDLPRGSFWLRSDRECPAPSGAHHPWPLVQIGAER